MKEVKRGGPQLEYVTDLVHRIQSLLPVEEAARTCVLSKSWLHAWSTNPTLMFRKPKRLVSKEEETNRMNSINRAVQRYYQHNIPIETFDLELRMENHESASLANKWIQIVATHTFLKELSLKLFNSTDSKFELTDEIFSGVNIDSVVIIFSEYSMNCGVWVTQNPVINCVSLRELELVNVEISEEVVDRLLSTCTLLEKINLSYLSDLMEINVKNLRHLQKLTINLQFLNNNYGTKDFSSINSVNNCVALKVIELTSVNISDEVLESLLSSCTLLEKIQLSFCLGLTKIKVKNLHYLQELKLSNCSDLTKIKVKNLPYLQKFELSVVEYEILEVDDVPNLQIFRYHSWYLADLMLNIGSLSRVTELVLYGDVLDFSLFDMINSNLPVLESLVLRFNSSCLEKFVITKFSLKKLRLELLESEQIDVQVYAPKLIHLCYGGPTIPNLMFVDHTAPEEIHLILKLRKAMNNPHFYKMREVVSLSNKFDIEIRYTFGLAPLDIDIDDLKSVRNRRLCILFVEERIDDLEV